jgi:hypothetical protein
VSRSALVFALLLWSWPAAGATGACPAAGDPAAGPLPGYNGPADFPADFGAVPEACGATDAAVRLRAAMLVAPDMPDYYGSVLGSAMLRGRYQLRERSTLSFAADVFNYRYVNGGGLASQGASFGPATATFQQAFPLGAATVTALYARLLLPLDTARESGLATGLELGTSVRVAAGARWVIGGGLSLAAPAELIGGQAHGRLEPGALGEVWLRVRPWVALNAGASIRVSVAPAFDLITTVPRLGARFAVRRQVWVAALVEVPVAGSDRTDVIGGLYGGYTPN